MPYSFILPGPARRYRVLVKARYYADGVKPDDQLVLFRFEGFQPSSSTPVSISPNTMGVQSQVLKAADGWKTFSVDFERINDSTQLRVKLCFNVGGTGLADGTIEIASFRIEDITESFRANGFATAAQTSASTAQAYQDAAGEFAQTATQQAGIASTKAGDASSYASQALTSSSDAQAALTTATQQAGISTSAKNDAVVAANEAKGSAEAAATSASSAKSFSDAAGSSASSASTAANTASVQRTGAETANTAATQAAAMLMPGDFVQDGLFFTNDLSGALPSSVSVGRFVTIS